MYHLFNWTHSGALRHKEVSFVTLLIGVLSDIYLKLSMLYGGLSIIYPMFGHLV